MYISIVVPLSRKENIGFVVDQLTNCYSDKVTLELVVAVDNRLISTKEVEKELQNLPFFGMYRNVTIFNTGNNPPQSFNVDTRRQRIAALHKKIKGHLGGSEFLFCFEDDTVLPPHVLDSLLSDWKKLSSVAQVGYIEGVQVGRWGRTYIGAWEALPDNKFRSLNFDNKGVAPISGGGFYCFLTTTDLYREASFEWEQPLGPDVWFGLELKQKGYSNFIDWEVLCGHRTAKGILWPDQSALQLEIEHINNRTIAKVINH